MYSKIETNMWKFVINKSISGDVDYPQSRSSFAMERLSNGTVVVFGGSGTGINMIVYF